MMTFEHDIRVNSVSIESDAAQRYLGVRLGAIILSCVRFLKAIEGKKPGRVRQLDEASEKLEKKILALIAREAKDPIEYLALIANIGTDLCVTHVERLEYLSFKLDIDGVGHEG